jgi:hypothetical protein
MSSMRLFRLLKLWLLLLSWTAITGVARHRRLTGNAAVRVASRPIAIHDTLQLHP